VSIILVFASVPCLTFGSDAELSVFRIEINTASSDKDGDSVPIRDFYISGGKDAGLSLSMILDIYRKKIVEDEVSGKNFEISILVGQVKVIGLFREVSIARIVSLTSAKDSPVLDYRSIMIGDYAVPGNSPKRAISKADRKVLREGSGVMLPSKLLFGLDDWQLLPEAKATLSAAHDIFNKSKDKKILVVGHTCNLGMEKHNLELSRKRAQSVSDYLVETAGIPPASISIEYYGARYPLASNDSEAGRVRNRRVDIRFMSAS